tara:strand:+ start:1139 stop:1258 length:120 start_codon:yes stop_codon:yes gene_type:complete
MGSYVSSLKLLKFSKLYAAILKNIKDNSIIDTTLVVDVT